MRKRRRKQRLFEANAVDEEARLRDTCVDDEARPGTRLSTEEDSHSLGIRRQAFGRTKGMSSIALSPTS